MRGVAVVISFEGRMPLYSRLRMIVGRKRGVWGARVVGGGEGLKTALT